MSVFRLSRNACFLFAFFLLFNIGACLSSAETLGRSDQAASATSTIAELQKQIDAKTEEIKQLEALSQKYRATITTTQSQALTLKSKIQRINNTIKSLQNDVAVTRRRIQRANLEISQLSLQIDNTEAKIRRNQKRTAELLKLIDRADREYILITLARNKTLAEFFNQIKVSVALHAQISEVIKEQRNLQSDLSKTKDQAISKVKQLKRYTAALQDKTALQKLQQADKAKLLAATNDQERQYQKLLKENEARRQALEQEVLEYEAKLHVSIDFNLLPRIGAGVLAWPVPMLPNPLQQCGATAYAFITQCFGNTAFARLGSYNGKGHNGVDFRAPSGTEIYAADSGVVRGVGDTDLQCRKASYGRWILIDHPDHLSTLYAHLSLIKVSPGQNVSRGDLIAYSGQTGYALGPHLHLSVFASQGVEIGSLRSRVCGTTMILPLSPFGGFLDPLEYLGSAS